MLVSKVEVHMSGAIQDSATRLGEIWPFGYFLLEHGRQFKTWFVVLILTFSSSWMEVYWIFNFLYILAKVCATFSEIGQFSFQSSGRSALDPNIKGLSMDKLELTGQNIG